MSVRPSSHALRAPVSAPPVSDNVVWQHATVTRAHRQSQNGHRAVILWFT